MCVVCCHSFVCVCHSKFVTGCMYSVELSGWWWYWWWVVCPAIVGGDHCSWVVVLGGGFWCLSGGGGGCLGSFVVVGVGIGT